MVGCVICSGSFSALLIFVSRSSFCGSSCGFNVFSKCLAKLFAFSHRAQVCSVLLIGGMSCIVWLLFRVDSRCKLPLLGFESVSEMFCLTFLFGLLIF
jgi:hypothetical protein